MKNSAKSNMYVFGLENTWDLFDGYLRGEHSAIIAIISSQELSDTARNALESSFSQLGYAPSGCVYVSLHGFGEAPTVALDEKALLGLIEGLDPLFLVVTDEDAVRACSAAYHRDIPFDKRARVLGREVRAFSSFEGMLKDSPGKQKAWGLLKTLPRFEN